MSYLFKGMEGLNTINQDLIYFVARKSMSIETNFDIVLPLKRTRLHASNPLRMPSSLTKQREEI